MSSWVKYRCDIDVLVVVDGIDASTKKKLVVDILERAIGVSMGCASRAAHSK